MRNALTRARSTRAFVLLSLTALLSACGQGGASGAGGPGGAGGPPAVSVVPVLQKAVQEQDQFSARLEAPDTVELRARVAGTLEGVHFREGQRVSKGQLLVVLEAMKMEHSIRAPQAGVVKGLYCSEGELVSEGAALVELEEA